MRYRCPPEFRRKVLDLLAGGRSVASIAADVGVSGQTIHNWRRQGMIGTGQVGG
jgi:transposase-like protein